MPSRSCGHCLTVTVRALSKAMSSHVRCLKEVDISTQCGPVAGEDHPQQGVPVEEDKYEMKTCANHVDEMEHYPVQGAMGLKEMNAQELAEFKGFRSELGELPGPTVEELATIPASYDLRTKWPQCKWLNNPGNQGGCGSCWVPPDHCPSTAHPLPIQSMHC